MSENDELVKPSLSIFRYPQFGYDLMEQYIQGDIAPSEFCAELAQHLDGTLPELHIFLTLALQLAEAERRYHKSS